MAYPVNDLVLEIGEIGITGNIIPAHWYQALTFDNGKPNFVAVTLLSEIVYWYRPKIQKDESTGLVKPPQKKFKADFLQRNTKQFAAQFGFSDKQARDGLRFLEDKGIIKRHLRTLTLESGLVLSNVLFVELISSGLKKLQKIHTYGHAGQDLLPPTSNPIDMQGGTYTETSSKTSTEKDNVSTLPFFKKTNEKRKKDIVSTLPSSKKTNEKRKKDNNLENRKKNKTIFGQAKSTKVNKCQPSQSPMPTLSVTNANPLSHRTFCKSLSFNFKIGGKQL